MASLSHFAGSFYYLWVVALPSSNSTTCSIFFQFVFFFKCTTLKFCDRFDGKALIKSVHRKIYSHLQKHNPPTQEMDRSPIPGPQTGTGP